MSKEKQISIQQWGKDHWSTFSYAETLAVDYGKNGLIIPDKTKMRTNEKTHPHLVGRPPGNFGGSKYPTRLKDGVIDGHDDWDCLDDMVKIKLLTDEGTGLNRVYRLTKLGKVIANQLRNHKIDGGNFREFNPSFQEK